MNVQRSRKSLESKTQNHKRRGKLAEKLREVIPSLACDNAETMPLKISRVFGPYRHGSKFRLFVYNPERRSMVVETLEEAERIKAALLQEARVSSPDGQA